MSKSKNRLAGLNDVPTVNPDPVVAETAAQLYNSLNPVINVHVRTIENYCNAMAPGMNVIEIEGARWNNALFNAILSILEYEDVQAFVEGMDEVFKLFARESRGALNSDYVHRFVDKMMLSDDRLSLYNTLINVLTTFAIPRTRNLYGQYYDIEHNQNNGLRYLSPEAKERLIYYINRQ
jgi:hypothetical protein|nr:MAG TPA: hypothetical protein [Caudoviricetes sp.]